MMTNLLQRNGKTSTILIVLIALGAIGAGVYFLMFNQPKPEARVIPRIELESIDSEIADAISGAIEKIESNPEDAEAWGNLGEIYYAHNYGTKSVEALKVAQDLAPTVAKWPYLRGMIFAEADVSAGMPLVEKALELAPDDVEIRARHAEFLFDLRDMEAAEKEFRDILKVRKHPRLHVGLARVYFRQGELEKSRKQAEEAKTMADSHRAPYEMLVRIYQKMGETQKAKENLQILKRIPKDFNTWPDSNMDAIRKKRKDTSAIDEKISELVIQGRTGEALLLIKQQLKADPKNPFWMLLYLRQQVARKNYKAATKAAIDYKAADYGSVEIDVMRAIIAMRTEKMDEVISICEDILTRKADCMTAEVLLGRALRVSGKPQESIAHLEKALNMAPGSYEAHMEMSQSLMLVNRKEEAMKFLEIASGLKEN